MIEYILYVIILCIVLLHSYYVLFNYILEVYNNCQMYIDIFLETK